MLPIPGQREILVREGQRHWLDVQRTADAPRVGIFHDGGWSVAVTGVYGAAIENDVLIVARYEKPSFVEGEFETILAFARLIPVAMQHAGIGSPLDDLVTHLATQLMSVSAANFAESVTQVVRTLAEFFTVSTAFLRRNDHQLGASILLAEWPIRENIPDPDPLGIVPFEGPNTDPVFAAVRDLREPLVVRPDQEDRYQERVHEASGLPPVALATVPILRDDVTSGVLGFVNFGDRVWSKAELNALRAIAALLAQLERRVEAEERLQRGAYRDELTGLANRRAFREALTARLEDPAADPALVVFADLDRLKSINDSLGHATGDTLLRGVAGRLQEQLGPKDMVARLGGDEFVVLLGSRVPDPRAWAEALVDAVTSRPLDLETAKVPVTMCAGIALAAPGTLSAEELVHRADIALIEAKAGGPGRVVLFDETMLAKSEVRADINRHLRDAAADQALQLYYLPEIDLRSGALVAVEALVRWHHPTLGLLMPASFIPLAEEAPTVIAEIGAWVLDEACRQLAAWRRELPDRRFIIRVNVSPVQLMVQDMAAIVSSALGRHGLEGPDLCLELTERAVLREMDQVLRVLEAVRRLGVTVALDDFGTGYSTLTQLRWLPVDTLKVDRQFITELGSNAEDMAIVESTILLSKKFALDVVAEGVETISAARELIRMGCHRIEGNLVHSAAPPDVLRPLITRGGIDLGELGLATVDRG
jgi:diguanylate cyclase (GGDEF)-like protein